MFQVIFGFAGVLLIALEIFVAAFPALKKILPLGGTSLTQMAIVFGAAFVTAESLYLLGLI